MSKTIITVVGKDTVEIIAKACTCLVDNRISILGISQATVQGFFNMVMVVDNDGAAKLFETVSEELEQLGDEIGVKIKYQKKEVSTEIHRV